MSKAWINRDETYKKLKSFFKDNSDDLIRFGNTINQVFEAFVFASLASWYKKNGWNIKIVNPKNFKEEEEIKLKFSTRGRPSNYTYIQCSKNDEIIEIRHQLRVETKFNKTDQEPPANVCLDVAVIKKNEDLNFYSTNDYIANSELVTFAEAKHMSAYAELIANFIGLVHEIQPARLKCLRAGKKNEHPAPFLYVSGILYRTAEGIKLTIKKRKYDMEIYCKAKHLVDDMALPTEKFVTK